MNLNLKQRLITSSILFFLLLIILFVHNYVFILLTFIISIIVVIEILNLTNLIYKKKNYFTYLSFNLLSFFYIFGIFFFSIIALKSYLGTLFLFYILCICFFTDIGGFIIGKKFGVKKLTKISPNKTVMGSVGSFLFSLFPIFLFNFLDSNQFFFSMKNIFFCLIVSLVSQLGDLIISFIKRKAHVKNTGKILPGHGGFLDRIDGILFAIPFVFILIFGFDNFFNHYLEIVIFLLNN